MAGWRIRFQTHHPKLADIASDVAWRFSAYGSYGENRATALRALRRRAPEFDREEREQAFDNSLALVADCRVVVDAGLSLINYRGNTDLGPFRRRLRSHVDRLGPDTVDAILGMVIYYYHLK
jgi:hypothetical protein